MFRLRSIRNLHKPGLLLAACLLASAVASATEVPAASLRCENATGSSVPIGYCSNGRYFCVGTALRPLVGVSSDAGCHIPLADFNNHALPDPDKCNRSNSKEVLDSIFSQNLNKMRLWVSLRGNSPFLNDDLSSAHPFVYVPNPGYWRLDRPNETYFNKLENVIDYARVHNPSYSITVEVTFFAPGEGDFPGGPWDNAKGKVCVNGAGDFQPNDVDCTQAGHTLKDAGFSNPIYFAQTAADPINGDRPRQVQRKLIQWTVDRLWCYDNVYWEIANEPEGTAAPSLVALWHTDMVNQTVDAEAPHVGQIPGVTRRHRIAVNPSNTTVNYLTMANVDVVNGHYTEIYSTPGNMGAIQLIRGSGNSAFNAGKLLGFNETKISSISSQAANSFSLPLVQDPNDLAFYGGPDSARAEGWEFMLDRGAVYDHWGYRYGSQIGQDVRAQMGNLRAFISGLPLRQLVRSSADNSNSHPGWLPTLQDWGTFRGAPFNARIFWAALEPTSTATTPVYALYLHNSLRRCKSGTETSTGCTNGYLPLNGYNPVIGAAKYEETLTLSLTPGKSYTVEWIRPKNRGSLKTPFTLTYNADNSCTGGDSTFPCQIKSPKYDYDIALLLRQNPDQDTQLPSACSNFTCTNLSCSFDANCSTDNQGIASYSWSFSDSTLGSGVTTSHTFPSIGVYTVALTVTDTSGLQSSMSKKVSVTNEIPVAAESFFTVPPCRIADTQATTPLTNGVQRTFQVTGLCGIPASAKAVSFNVTVVSPTGPGHLIFFPGNQTSGPFVHATISLEPANSPRSNNAILRLATNGAGTINVLPAVAASPGQVHVILDVYGYFSEDATPAPGAQGPFGFQTLTPCRIADTRTGAPIAANTSRNFTVQGVCGVPAGAAAAPLNLTVIGPTAGGQATLYQTGPLPPVSTLSFNAGVVLTNGARIRLAPATPDVSVNYFSPGGNSTHAVIDVYGYFKTGAPLKYRPITPCRAVDTRFADQGGPVLGAPDSRNFQIRGNCGVPLTAKAVAVNITTVNAAGGGYLAAYPSGSALPLASYLTFDPGQGALANGGIVALSTLPDDLAITTANSTHVIIDVFGYFQ